MVAGKSKTSQGFDNFEGSNETKAEEAANFQRGVRLARLLGPTEVFVPIPNQINTLLAARSLGTSWQVSCPSPSLTRATAACCRRLLDLSCLLPIAVAVLSASANSADIRRPPAAGDTAIVIGFVGGFVHHNDTRHAAVQVAEKLQREYEGTAHVQVFENHHLERAHAAILKWLDRDRAGRLSDPEKQQARIVLYGHSWGGAAVVALARQLEREHIPILLTIQVDSISKPGHDDNVVPANVARAINFYQTRGPFHGKPIVAADPAHTEILGDFRFSYNKEPEPCSKYPWFARHFMKGHISIECDPNIWSRVEGLITEYLFPHAAESPKPASDHPEATNPRTRIAPEALFPS